MAHWCTAAVVAGLAAVSIASVFTLRRIQQTSTKSARAQLQALGDADHLHHLLYQKGFVSEFFLTDDPRRLEDLKIEEQAFRAWLSAVRGEARSAQTKTAVEEIDREYRVYDNDRDQAVALYQAGNREQAIRALTANRRHASRLRDLATSVIEARRAELAGDMDLADAAFRQALVFLLGFFALAMSSAAGLGYLFARRIGRPLYELVLHTESTMGPRVEMRADDEVAVITAHVTYLAGEVERAWRTLEAERVKVVQAEKMSALGEMATAIAHEVLNPLAGIKVALQLLARMESSKAVCETVAAADREIARVDRIARRLIAFARPLQLVLRPCDLAAMVTRAVDAVRAEQLSSEISLACELEQSQNVVRGDPDLLEQVLLNLARNACQAIAGPGHVRIRVGQIEGWRTIEVADDGMGLAPEIAPKLFTPFVTTKPDGHGLGLALSQSIALAHGGRIEARSNKPDRGTTFVVYLPEAA